MSPPEQNCLCDRQFLLIFFTDITGVHAFFRPGSSGEMSSGGKGGGVVVVVQDQTAVEGASPKMMFVKIIALC